MQTKKGLHSVHSGNRKHGTLFRKAVAVMGILAALTALFGCAKAPKPTPAAQHTASDISGVSIACTHMDFSYSYFFEIRREGETWLFDAECFTQDHTVPTSLENREVGKDEVDTLLGILNDNDLIAYAENSKKPREPLYEALDETTYTFSLTFSDGSQYQTSGWQQEPETFFYRLAESMASDQSSDQTRDDIDGMEQN